jgi:hypothetical protein
VVIEAGRKGEALVFLVPEQIVEQTRHMQHLSRDDRAALQEEGLAPFVLDLPGRFGAHDEHAAHPVRCGCIGDRAVAVGPIDVFMPAMPHDSNELILAPVRFGGISVKFGERQAHAAASVAVKAHAFVLARHPAMPARSECMTK